MTKFIWQAKRDLQNRKSIGTKLHGLEVEINEAHAIFLSWSLPSFGLSHFGIFDKPNSTTNLYITQTWSYWS